ncbi:hypothetical protein DMA11_18845 [Marinilabiliaceae bacterium JC017]|nr:hypothetical protein DMA11_18845 [Marinilabiliaceae bacterium JC017]
MVMDTKKIQALIALLDDPSEEIFSVVEGELLKEPVDIVPELEKAWESSLNTIFQERLENIIHHIQFQDIHNALERWVAEGGKDLLFGAYLVSKYQYPELSYVTITKRISELQRAIWMELNEHLTSLEKVRIINHILFDVNKFTRNNSQFLAPQNNYISDVLENQKGNPVTLSIIYSVLCQRLGLPVYGVNLPKNFILVFMDNLTDNDEENLSREATPLFYINPINKGAVLGRREIEYFIKQQKLQPSESFFLPCSNQEAIKRLITNLRFAYENIGLEEKSKDIQSLLDIFKAIKK